MSKVKFILHSILLFAAYVIAGTGLILAAVFCLPLTISGRTEMVSAIAEALDKLSAEITPTFNTLYKDSQK